MTYGSLNEATVEEAGLAWFEGLGYETRFGTEITPGGGGRHCFKTGSLCQGDCGRM